MTTKKIKKRQSTVAELSSPYPATTTAGGAGKRDGASEEEHVDDGKRKGTVAQAAPEKTARLPRKKKQHRKKGDTLIPAEEEEDGDLERPRKRHKLRSSNGDALASPGDYSHMRSRPLTAAAEDSSSRSSPVVPSSSSPVSSSSSSSPEPEPPTGPQSVLDHRTRNPASPPPFLQRFPLPSRPHAPEKSELASQGLDRALAGAQLVDPLLSTPLSLDDENGDGITGLSARTLRRLRDLGIVELFAGVWLSYHVAFRKPTVLSCTIQFSPDYTATLVPTSRTSEAVSVPPV